MLCLSRCAGEIAAVPNTYCAVGVAYGAKVSGNGFSFVIVIILFFPVEHINRGYMTS